VVVIIEHLSKAIWLAGVPSKEPAWIRRELERVLGMVGAVGELVSDRGGEFEGAVRAALHKWQIDPRRSSAYHPATNGLCERAVQTVKSLLRRSILAVVQRSDQKEDAPVDWEFLLPEVQLAVNCTPQASTGLPPNLLLFGRNTGIPAVARQQIWQPLNLDNSEEVIVDLLDRMAVLRVAIPFAMNNLEIAQHRDTLRYARVAGGGYTRAVVSPQERQLVYLKKHGGSLGVPALEAPVHDTILQIVEIRPSGRVIIMGVEGDTAEEHVSNLTPCNLPNVDTTVHPVRPRDVVSIACQFCNSVHCSNTGDFVMALCERCFKGFHLGCMRARGGGWVAPPPGTLRLSSSQWFCYWCQVRRDVPAGTGPDGIFSGRK